MNKLLLITAMCLATGCTALPSHETAPAEQQRLNTLKEAENKCRERDGVHKLAFFWSGDFEVMCEDGSVHSNTGNIVHSWAR